MADEFEISADERLCHAVTDALSRSEPIRASSLDSIIVKATNGKVDLEGIVASDPLRYVAEQLASSVPGVKALANHLTTPEQVERRVGTALAADAYTRHLHIAVRAGEGAVTLYGAVESEAEASGAETVAATAAGSLKVHSRLQILTPGEHVILLWQDSLEGRNEVPVKADEATAGTADEHLAATSPTEAPPAATVGGTA